MSESDPRRGPIVNIPIPDPSVLTNVSIADVEQRLRREFTYSIEAVRELIEIRISNQRELSTERFASMKADVATAFLNATSATAKSEASTTKEIDSLKTSIGALKEVLDEKIGTLSERMNREQGRVVGNQTTTTSGRENLFLVVAMIAVLIAGWTAFNNRQSASPAISLPPAVTISPAPKP